MAMRRSQTLAGAFTLLALAAPPNAAAQTPAAPIPAALTRLAATASQVTQTICVQHTNGANQGDIAVVQFAGAATMLAIFDNLSFSRIATSP